MKRLTILLLPFLLNSCSETKRPEVTCQTVLDITTPAGCYDKTKGLVLTATNMDKATKMLWVIAPLADTTTSQSYVPVYFNTDSSSVSIPDSIAMKYPKIGIVFAGTEDCVSDYYFSFVRRYDGVNSCFTWHQQEKFYVGD